VIVELRLKGAIILAVGFGLGYAKAVHDTDEIRVLLQELIEELRNFNMPGPPAEDGEAEEVVDAIEVAVPEPGVKGETP
jgi:hypothetical protein